jgi:hypothetical protein
MEFPLDRADVNAILVGVFNANVKLSRIMEALGIDGEEEEEDLDA